MKTTQTYQSGRGENALLFAAKEAYRTIRTNLMFSLAKTGCKTILFTSSIQGEGKTTTSCNVAFSLARSNKRVLLMDVDLRKPYVHRLVKRPNSPGLTNFLSGFNSLEEVIHKDVFTGLDVICAGTISPNPAEMAASEGLAQLLQSLKSDYDFIILDVPPVNLVSDALSLMPHVDGVVMVVRPNYTARTELQKAISQIGMVGGKVLGVVANAAQIEKKRGYGKYRYGGYGSYGTYGTYGTPAAKTLNQQAPAPSPEAEEKEEPKEAE